MRLKRVGVGVVLVHKKVDKFCNNDLWLNDKVEYLGKIYTFYDLENTKENGVRAIFRSESGTEQKLSDKEIEKLIDNQEMKKFNDE